MAKLSETAPLLAGEQTEKPTTAQKIVSRIDSLGELVKTYIDTPAKDAMDYINFGMQSSIVPIDPDSPFTSRMFKKATRLTGQAAHLMINIGAFVTVQPFNAVRKPISMMANIVKFICISTDKSKFADNELTKTGMEILKNARDTIIAWGTLTAGVMTLGAAPVMLASLGLTTAGVATTGAVGAVQQAGVATAIWSNTPAVSIASYVETVAKGAYLGIEHHFVTP